MTLRTPDYYSGNHLPILTRPKKPTNPGYKGNAEDYKKFAEDLAVYEVEAKKYNGEFRELRLQHSNLREELVEDLALENGIPVKAAKLIFEVVWEEHSSCGIAQVMERFGDMLDLIDTINAELNKNKGS